MSGPSRGRIMWGTLLVLVGLLWLLYSVTDLQVPIELVLPAALIAVGFGLVVGARSGEVNVVLLLVGLGLTVVLAGGTAVRPWEQDLELVGGGVGDRAVRPTTAGEVADGYRLSAGTLRVDLTELDVRRPVDVRARVDVGRLEVVVPDHVDVEVRSRVEAGRITVFGQDRGSGLRVSDRLRADGRPLLRLALEVRVGRIEVERRVTPLSPPSPRATPAVPRVEQETSR